VGLELRIQQSDCVTAVTGIDDEIPVDDAGDDGNGIIPGFAENPNACQRYIGTDAEAIVTLTKVNQQTAAEGGCGCKSKCGSAPVDCGTFKTADEDAVQAAGDFKLIGSAVAADHCVAILQLDKDVAGEKCTRFEVFHRATVMPGMPPGAGILSAGEETLKKAADTVELTKMHGTDH